MLLLHKCTAPAFKSTSTRQIYRVRRYAVLESRMDRYISGCQFQIIAYNHISAKTTLGRWWTSQKLRMIPNEILRLTLGPYLGNICNLQNTSQALAAYQCRKNVFAPAPSFAYCPVSVTCNFCITYFLICVGNFCATALYIAPDPPTITSHLSSAKSLAA